MLYVRADKTTWNPGEILRATTNAEPEYTITAIVEGAVVASSDNEPLLWNIPLAYGGCVVELVVTHEGESASWHCYIDP